MQPVGDNRRKLHKVVEPKGKICRGEVLLQTLKLGRTVCKKHNYPKWATVILSTRKLEREFQMGCKGDSVLGEKLKQSASI